MYFLNTRSVQVEMKLFHLHRCESSNSCLNIVGQFIPFSLTTHLLPNHALDNPFCLNKKNFILLTRFRKQALHKYFYSCLKKKCFYSFSIFYFVYTLFFTIRVVRTNLYAPQSNSSRINLRAHSLTST